PQKGAAGRKRTARAQPGADKVAAAESSKLIREARAVLASLDEILPRSPRAAKGKGRANGASSAAAAAPAAAAQTQAKAKAKARKRKAARDEEEEEEESESE